MGLLCGNAVQHLGPDAGQFALGKGRVADDIGKQRECRRQIGLQRIECQPGPVNPGGCPDARPNPFAFLDNLGCASGRGAFVDQCQHQALCPELCLRVGGITSIKGQDHPNHRHGCPARQRHFHAVGKPRSFNLGKIKLREAGDRRRDPGWFRCRNFGRS